MSADSTTLDLASEDGNAADHDRIVRTRRTLILILGVLVVLLLLAFVFLLNIFKPPGEVADSSEAGGVEWVRSIYGWGNTEEKQLLGPAGVAVGPDSTIWVTDQSRSQIEAFNPDGSFAGIITQGPRGTAENSFAWPTSVAVDEDGLIYIGDQEGSRVYRFSRDREPLGFEYVPRPTAVAARGDRVVVGSASGFVIMTKNGDVIKVLGSQGTGDDQFMSVRGVAIGADGTIYVVDQYNNRVSAYDSNGNRKWIRVTGNPGNQASLSQSMVSKSASGTAGMQLPAALTIDGANRLIVVDPFGFNMVALDPKNGDLIARYGEPGTQDGKFIYPSGIAYDPRHDWFVVADTQNARVQIVRLPDSGGSTLATLNRTLGGPLRACLVPLLLLVVVVVASFVYRAIRRRRQEAPSTAAESPDAGELAGEVAGVVE